MVNFSQFGRELNSLYVAILSLYIKEMNEKLGWDKYHFIKKKKNRMGYHKCVTSILILPSIKYNQYLVPIIRVKLI